MLLLQSAQGRAGYFARCAVNFTKFKGACGNGGGDGNGPNLRGISVYDACGRQWANNGEIAFTTDLTERRLR